MDFYLVLGNEELLNMNLAFREMRVVVCMKNRIK